MEIVNQAVEFVFCASSPRGLTRTIIKRVSWERPSEGWVKFNTDGAAKGNLGLAGCDGVVKDENGKWLAGFSKRIGISTSFVVELWGLREGLILCSDLNAPFLVVELDVKAVVECFLNPNYHNNVISPILDDCRQLMRRFLQIQVRHCYHQANRCADMLARMSTNQEHEFISFDYPHVDISNIVDEDSAGLYVNRACSVSDGFV